MTQACTGRVGVDGAVCAGSFAHPDGTSVFCNECPKGALNVASTVAVPLQTTVLHPGLPVSPLFEEPWLSTPPLPVRPLVLSDLRWGAPAFAPATIERSRADWRRFSVGVMVEWWVDDGLSGTGEVQVRMLHDDGETSVTCWRFLYVMLAAA